jgi:hypothetical protein
VDALSSLPMGGIRGPTSVNFRFSFQYSLPTTLERRAPVSGRYFKDDGKAAPFQYLQVQRFPGCAPSFRRIPSCTEILTKVIIRSPPLNDILVVFLLLRWAVPSGTPKPVACITYRRNPCLGSRLSLCSTTLDPLCDMRSPSNLYAPSFLTVTLSSPVSWQRAAKLHLSSQPSEGELNLHSDLSGTS